MGKSNQPKDIRPNSDENAAKAPMDANLRLVLINIVSMVLICIVFIGANYLLQDNLISNKLKQLTPAEENADEELTEDDDVVQRGVIVDLGDFILNLSDTDQKKYLKVNVALELTKKPEDSAPPAAESGGHGHGAPAAEDPMKALETEMAQFKPAIRDIVITTLSSKTSAEVSTAAGKELSKEQISEAVNALFAGEREIIRVSFGQFIIQ